MEKVTKDMLIGDIVRKHPDTAPILLEVGMHCLGCPSSQMESLEDACGVHGVDPEQIKNKINAFLESK